MIFSKPSLNILNYLFKINYISVDYIYNCVLTFLCVNVIK